jgi:hypothetical protein
MLTEGAQIGQWRVTGSLGQGGMGQVFLVEHALLTGRTCVLKVPLPGIDPRRFEREWRALAAITHPHIVPIVDAGVSDAAGGSYFVMPRFPHTLLDRLDEVGRLPTAAVLQLAVQIGGALDAVHAQGVVHHVLLDDAGNAVLADFGVAHLAGRTKLTRTGLQPGTETYSSPEQIHGKALSGASDQYSLACLLYEALIGRPPFEGDLVSVLYAHATRDPEPPSNFSRDLPPAVDDVFARALAKDPGARYPSIGALATELDAALTPPVGGLSVGSPRCAPLLDRTGGEDGPTLSEAVTGPFLVIVNPWTDSLATCFAEYAAAVEQWHLDGPVKGKRLKKLPASVTLYDTSYTPLPIAMPNAQQLWAEENLKAISVAAGVRGAHVKSMCRLIWIPSGGYGPGQSQRLHYTFTEENPGPQLDVTFLERDDRKVGHLSRQAVLKQFPKHGSRWSDLDRNLARLSMRSGVSFDKVVQLAGRTPSAVLAGLVADT